MKAKGTLAILCALSLALVACGGNSSSTSTATETATEEAATTESTTEAQETAATSAVTSPVGVWKVAGAESNGITMTGDIAGVTAMSGGDEAASLVSSMQIELKEDGTGSFTAGEDTVSISWEESNGSIPMTLTREDGTTTEMTASLKDGVLSFVMDEEEGMVILLTHDGSYPNAKTYDKSAAKAITSEADLIGTWQMKAVVMMGVTMSGDQQALASQFGYDAVTAVFSEGGKATMFGDDTTYVVGADGASVQESGSSDFMAPLLALDGDVLVDLSDMAGFEVFIVLEK